MYKDICSINGIVETVDEMEAIKNSISNIILTLRGSLPGKPNFGSDVIKSIFAPIDGLQSSILKNYIRESIAEFEPRVTLKEIQIKGVEEYNKIIIDIYFSYKHINGTVNTSTSVSINL